jgi:hypothetical protein
MEPNLRTVMQLEGILLPGRRVECHEAGMWTNGRGNVENHREKRGVKDEI